MSTRGTSIVSQTMTLMKPHWTITYRDPSVYVGRMAMFLMACIFFAVIYIEARTRNQEQIFARMWLVMCFLGVPTSLGVVATYVANEEFFAIKREVKNGTARMLGYNWAGSWSLLTSMPSR